MNPIEKFQNRFPEFRKIPKSFSSLGVGALSRGLALGCLQQLTFYLHDLLETLQFTVQNSILHDHMHDLLSIALPCEIWLEDVNLGAGPNLVELQNVNALYILYCA